MNLVELPPVGVGYYYYGAANQRWMLPQVMAALGEACATMYRDFGLEVGIGNASLEHGGPVAGHVSHQGGLDVDVRPARRDRQPLPVNIKTQPKEYDQFLTRTLINRLQRVRFTKFIINDSALAGMAGISSLKGHDDHLHCTWGVLVEQ